MPSKKKKYNARFPPARIKKIMQSDEEVGKVAQAVPVIISRALELFVESLLKKAEVVTQARNAKTLTPSHLKQCIMMESRFDFLRDLVSTVSDVQGDDDGGSGAELGARVGSSGSTEGEPYNPYPTHQGVIQTTGTVPSTSSAASTSTRPEGGQHQLPSYASGIPDYLSLQQNQQVQQHSYVKTETAGASGGPMYMPQAAVPSSTMTSNSNQPQHIQHSQPIYQGQPSQVIMHHDSYIPQHHQGGGGYPLQAHPEHGRHFFYGQYDHNNGQVKPETSENTQAYGEHGAYGYDRSGQHY